MAYWAALSHRVQLYEVEYVERLLLLVCELLELLFDLVEDDGREAINV